MVYIYKVDIQLDVYIVHVHGYNCNFQQDHVGIEYKS